MKIKLKKYTFFFCQNYFMLTNNLVTYSHFIPVQIKYIITGDKIDKSNKNL